MRRILTTAVAVGLPLAAALAPAVPAAAHTESDLIAVPAGSDATITLKPTHGCGGSPTVAVRIRAPFPDARAEQVDGWTATATPDGDGNTVLEWTGGVLPADQDGAFPVEFVVPDAPGTLLTFPAIQACENGEELAWISGDPTDEFPAPRVLVLPAGSAPAASLDEVPLDAPGRDQLVAIVDVDNPRAPATTTAPVTTAAPTAAPTTAAAPTTTTVATTTTATETAPTTSAPVATAPTDPAASSPTTSDGGSGGSTATIVVVAIVVAVALAVTAVVLVRRRATD